MIFDVPFEKPKQLSSTKERTNVVIHPFIVGGGNWVTEAISGMFRDLVDINNSANFCVYRRMRGFEVVGGQNWVSPVEEHYDMYHISMHHGAAMWRRLLPGCAKWSGHFLVYVTSSFDKLWTIYNSDKTRYGLSKSQDFSCTAFSFTCSMRYWHRLACLSEEKLLRLCKNEAL